MERRLFLQLPLIALASSAMAKIPVTDNTRPNKGFKVEGGHDRFGEELHIMGGQFNCIISTKDTMGDLCAFDTFRQEKGGPALHYHTSQDEWFYNITGEFIVQVGEERFNMKPGDSLFAPRTIPHAFAKISEGDAHMLVLFQPAGTMEDFFKEMSKLGKSIPADMEHLMKELWHTHGMEVVGPPLKF